MLVDEFASYHVPACLHPPDGLIQQLAGRSSYGGRDVDGVSVFDDFFRYYLMDLRHCVLLWTVKLIGLRRGAVVLDHNFKGGSNVDSLIDG